VCVAAFKVVFAPFEADHQLVSLQRAGIIDIILSEDGDLTHLGARAGSVLSNYITRRATGYRYQYYQPDSTARPRSIRAALLGTDYNHNLNLVNWNMVDATTEKLVLGLGGSVDFGDLVDSVELLRLCEAKASRTRTRTIVPKELVSECVDSVLMFQHGPVAVLAFTVPVTNDEERRAAFWRDAYTATVQPLNAVPAAAPRARAWWRTNFVLTSGGEDAAETPFFRGDRWARGGAAFVLPAYTVTDYARVHGTPVGLDLLGPATLLPEGALLPYIPQLCSDSQLLLWCKIHLIPVRGATTRHSVVGEHGVESKGFEEVVVSSLRETASRNPPVTSQFAIERGLVDPEPALSDGDPVEAGVIDIICALQLSDHWLHDNLQRLDLVVANDQLTKGIRYVKGGHLDTATLDVRRVLHEVHGELLMIVAVVVASRKTTQYRCRVCFTLAKMDAC